MKKFVEIFIFMNFSMFFLMFAEYCGILHENMSKGELFVFFVIKIIWVTMSILVAEYLVNKKDSE